MIITFFVLILQSATLNKLLRNSGLNWHAKICVILIVLKIFRAIVSNALTRFLFISLFFVVTKTGIDHKRPVNDHKPPANDHKSPQTITNCQQMSTNYHKRSQAVSKGPETTKKNLKSPANDHNENKIK